MGGVRGRGGRGDGVGGGGGGWEGSSINRATAECSPLY